MDYSVLKSLDKDLDSLKQSMYKQNSLKLEDKEVIILKAINEKFKDVVGLANYLIRNQSELCKTAI